MDQIEQDKELAEASMLVLRKRCTEITKGIMLQNVTKLNFSPRTDLSKLVMAMMTEAAVHCGLAGVQIGVMNGMRMGIEEGKKEALK